MILVVRYQVKVYAKVDTVTGEVLSVNEDDENVVLDYGQGHNPLTVVEAEEGGPAKVSESTARKAVRIAETDDWPAWERGW